MTAAAPLQAALRTAHEAILLAGVLGLLSVLAGVLSRRIGAPMLLAFLALGMLAGNDGLLGLGFHDYADAYLIGSLALAVILFEGGLKTPLHTLRRAFWPATLLATVGVVATAAIVGVGVALLDRVPVRSGLLAGAIVAPTDAAAVAVLLRGTRAAIPERLLAVLEVESGLNDPVSVLLTFMLMRLFVGAVPSAGGLVLDLGWEMLGGAAIGLGAGWALAVALRRLPMEPALATVLALAGAFAVFGLAQLVGASGFLATYLAGMMAAGAGPALRARLEPFFEGMGWLAQIVLFLMLGLLVTPHLLLPFVPSALAGTAVLVFLARPAAVFACLPPFGFGWRESAFASWVGLRGAVPIYLSLIPALVEAGQPRDQRLIASIFIAVVASLIVQGWTIGLAARLLGFRQR